MIKFIDRLYGWFLIAANSLQSPLLLAIRLYWGWQFWQAGHGKLGNISKTVEFFTNLNIPAPSLNAHFVAYLEAGGGILLAIGLGSRLIALPLAVDMIVAYLTADRDSLRAIFSDDAGQFYKADPFSFLLVSLVILVFGPGKFSLDTLIRWYRNKRQTPAPSA